MASSVAIGVMGLVAYLFFASFASFADIVPFATLVTTALCGACAMYAWHDEETYDLSTLGWVYLALGFWAAAGVLFCVACWLAKVSFDQALELPEVLWQRRSGDLLNPSTWADSFFRLAMAFGPGVALIAIGSVVRGLVLRISGVPPESPAIGRRTVERIRIDDEASGTKKWTLSVLVLLLAFIVVGPHLGNPTINNALSYWQEQYYGPTAILGFIFAFVLIVRWHWRDFRERSDPWSLLYVVTYLLGAIVVVLFLSWKAIFGTA